jgi:AraC family transcriptional regulator
MNRRATGQELAKIRKLIGAATRDQLRYVDCFVSRDVGLFMPVGGACFYALTPEHTHPSYLFVLHFNDRSEIRLNGKLVRGRHGKMFSLAPGIRHQEMPSDAPPHYIAALIEKNFFEKAARKYPGMRTKRLEGSFSEIDRSLLPVVKRFMIEADSGLPGSVAVLDALAVEICHSIIRGILKTAPRQDRVSERIEVNRVIEHLHSHIDDKISIPALAAIARLSPSHFARVFRKETGKSPMEYVHGLRMERVRKLLLAGDKSMTEISLECGFGSPSYLAACFQKQFKMAPSEYLKSMSGKQH